MQVAPAKIVVTGGASKDQALLQVLANVMNCRVERLEITKSAALGAALQAAHGWQVAQGGNARWEKLVAGFTAPVPGSAVIPNKRAAKVYDGMLDKYAGCEEEALEAMAGQ